MAAVAGGSEDPVPPSTGSVVCPDPDVVDGLALDEVVDWEDTEGTGRDGVFTVGTCTEDAGEDGSGTLTVGVVTRGTVTDGTVTDGTVTVEGTDTVGVVTVGVVTVGTVTDGTLTPGMARALLRCGCTSNTASTASARRNPPATMRDVPRTKPRTRLPSLVRTARLPPVMVRAKVPIPG